MLTIVTSFRLVFIGATGYTSTVLRLKLQVVEFQSALCAVPFTRKNNLEMVLPQNKTDFDRKKGGAA